MATTTMTQEESDKIVGYFYSKMKGRYTLTENMEMDQKWGKSAFMTVGKVVIVANTQTLKKKKLII